MTPLLTKGLASTFIPVPAWGLFLNTVQVVLLPLLTGLFLHHFFPRAVKAAMSVSPLIAVITIALICGSIIGQNANYIKISGGLLLFAVFLLHAGGFALGYLFAKVLGYDEQIRRTISIEVGMQNSGLGVVLAQKNFIDPLTPVPCAISAVFHSVIGSILAGIWRLRTPKSTRPPKWRKLKGTTTHDEQIGMA